MLQSIIGPHSWLLLTFLSDRYRPGRSNKNADALSRQHPSSVHESGPAAPGTSVPRLLQQAVAENQVTQATVSAFPCSTALDLYALQEADPVINEFQRFWTRKRAPDAAERRKAPKEVLVLAKQWDRLVEQGGVLYHQVILSGDEVLQLVLPTSLKTQVLQQLHDEHGHQGAERTTELIRQRCYWPGMHHDIRQWCQDCERCQVAKDTQLVACAYMGHLLASRPNQVLAIDFTILEPSRNGMENILVMADVFSKVHPSHSNSRSASIHSGQGAG